MAARGRRGIGAVLVGTGAWALVAAGCGARTELGSVDGGHEEDAPHDVSPRDVSLDLEAGDGDAADAPDVIDASDVIDAADAADAPEGGCTGDEQNTQYAPTEVCGQGATWLAWEYVPSHTFTVAAIELHADDGSVALLDSSGVAPGATLATATLAPAGPPTDWKTGTLSAPVTVTAGHRYFIAEHVATCSVASTGTQYRYYGSFSSLSGPWDGPYQSWAWTSRLVCE